MWQPQDLGLNLSCNAKFSYQFEPSYVPLSILQLYPCRNEAEGQWASWGVLPLKWALLMSQTAFSPHTQPWKPQEHWENVHWHHLTEMCECFYGPLSKRKWQCQCLCKKCVCFLLDLLKWHKVFPSVSNGCWNQTTLHSLSALLHSLWLLPKPYICLFLFFSQLHLFPQLLCFNSAICPPELYRRYLIYDHCFNHTKLSRSSWKIIVLRFKISCPSSILSSSQFLLQVSAWNTYWDNWRRIFYLRW